MLKTYTAKYKIGQNCTLPDYNNAEGIIQSICFTYFDRIYKVRLNDWSLIHVYESLIKPDDSYTDDKVEYEAYSISSDIEYVFCLNGIMFDCLISGVEFFNGNLIYRIVVDDVINNNYNSAQLSSITPDRILTKEEALIKQRDLKLKKL